MSGNTGEIIFSYLQEKVSKFINDNECLIVSMNLLQSMLLFFVPCNFWRGHCLSLENPRKTSGNAETSYNANKQLTLQGRDTDSPILVLITGSL